ncbi:MAG TPA: hypothetical protein VFZ83_10795, partial [Acidimicrobiia bacterium]|nr:hypothetical protein [Acidimicrobiia bacterium]
PTLVVADTAVPIAPAPVATLLPGESVMVRVRFRLAHTAAVSGIGATTALRVTVGADSRAGANR